MWNKIGKGASEWGVSREFLLKGKDQYSWPPCTKFYSHHFLLFGIIPSYWTSSLITSECYHEKRLPKLLFSFCTIPLRLCSYNYKMNDKMWYYKFKFYSQHFFFLILVSCHQCWVSSHYHIRIYHEKSDTTTSNFIQNIF